MHKDKTYISVIVPLKFEEELCYFTSSGTSVGDRVWVNVGGREVLGVVGEIDIEPSVAPSRIREISGRDDSLQRISEDEIKLWRSIAEYYMCSVGEVFKAAYPSSLVSEEMKPLQAPKKAKGKKNPPKEDAMPAKDPLKQALEHKIMLSTAQEEAVRQIRTAFGKDKTALLDGMAGSGKTEVYMSFALDTLRKGKNILYLVPEIAMSRQLEERLKEVFGELLLVSHSDETMKKRRNAMETIRSGKPYIALGTRSSIFLPHRNLGLIIVDEEHDSSYKQESPAPRYNARDTAIMLGTIAGCHTLLGSATPSLESLYNCNTGRFSLIKLQERYYSAQETDTEIIDTGAERRKNGMSGSFSFKLIDKINAALQEGGQVMILRTRRAYSPVMQCSECGFIPKCPHCNVSLSYHKDKEAMRCHYCGYSEKMPLSQDSIYKCPKCGGTLKGLGSGTQKIEEEAAALFPDARIARLDSDTAKSEENRIIKEFSKGNIDILIGTQIVAKGFDFDNLTLVAALQADALLGMQDFRADEKAMQVLEQLRGRCGRRERKGLFVIQTSQPDHPVYQQFIKGGNEPDYSRRLLAERKEFGYPPYMRSMNVVMKDRNAERIDKMAETLANILQNLAEKRGGITVSSPWAPSASRVSDEHIRIIRINLNRDKSLGASKVAIASRIGAFENSERYHDHIYLDVDPV